MKTFFVVAAVAIVGYLGFRYLPEDFRKDLEANAKNALASVGLSRFSPASLLPPLKAKITPLANQITQNLKPDNPVAKRAAIIDKLEKEIQIIAKTPAPQTTKEKEAVKTAVQESQTLIQELKTENPKSGVVANAVNRIVNTITTESRSNQETTTIQECRN